jgi:hypothetical protein
MPSIRWTTERFGGRNSELYQQFVPHPIPIKSLPGAGAHRGVFRLHHALREHV